MSLPSSPPRSDDELLSSDSEESILSSEDYISPHSIAVDEAEQLESYFQWFPDVQIHRLADQEKKLEYWTDDLDEDLMLQVPIKISQMMMAGFYACLRGNFSKAQDLFDSTQRYIQSELNLGGDPFLIEAYMFLLNANRLMFLKRRGQGNGVEASLLFQKTITMDLYPAKSKAALLAMKAIFVGHLGLNRNKLAMWRRVIQLDPETLDWMHFFYRGLRSVRRERNHLSLPSDEEVDVCHKAYEINSNTPATVFDMTNLYDDISRVYYATGVEHSMWRDMGKANFLKELTYLATRSCELNPQSIRANIRLADVLAGSGFENMEVFYECEEQYLKCLQNWPRSSEVLHKIGKFYYRSPQGNSGLRKGVEFMKRSLELGWDNFACLMDYIRAHVRLSSPLEHTIQIMEEIIPLYRYKPVLQSKLYHGQASFYWQLNKPTLAARLWLKAIDTDPSCLEDGNLWEIMTCEKFFYKMRFNNAFHAVCSALSEMLSYEHRESFGPDLFKAMNKSFQSYLNFLNTRRLMQKSKRDEANAVRQGSGSRAVGYVKSSAYYKSEACPSKSWKVKSGSSYPNTLSGRTCSNWAARTSEDDASSITSASTGSHFTFDSETLKLLNISSASSAYSERSSSRSSALARNSARFSNPKSPARKSGGALNFDTDNNWRSK